jgi:hypothetical protein
LTIEAPSGLVYREPVGRLRQAARDHYFPRVELRPDLPNERRQLVVVEGRPAPRGVLGPELHVDRLSAQTLRCAYGLQRPTMADYVTVTGLKEEANAPGGRSGAGSSE